MIELIVAREGREVNRYFLPQGITTLGRADDNEIILDDVCVSRRHAQIRVEGVKVLIEDLGSGNGTFCGETRIARKELAHGDEIIIEPFALTLRKDSTGDAATNNSKRTPAKTVPPREMPDIGPPDSLMEPTDSRASEGTSGGKASPLRGPHLETVRGTGGRYPLERGEVRIGRAEDQDIVLKDPSASRGHAIISVRNSRYLLRDNSSANGTFVNGKQVFEHSLRPGDVILIGNTELQFVDPDSDRPTNKGAEPDDATPVPAAAASSGGGLAAGTASTGASAGGGMEMEMPIFDDSMDDPPTEAGMPPMAPIPQDDANMEGTIPGGPPPPVDPITDDLAGPAPGGGPLQPYDPNAGYGMEMEMGDGLYPTQAPPDGSLIDRLTWSFKNNPRFRLMAIGGTVFLVLIVFIIAVSGQKKGPTQPQLSNLQQQYLDAAKQTFRDAEQAYSGNQLDEAIRLYERAYETTTKSELAGIREAENLNRKATRQVLVLHEVKTLKMVGAELSERVQAEAASQEQIDEARNAMNRAWSAAQRRSTLSNWQRVVATAGQLLRYVPRDKTAKEYRTEGRQNVSRIVGAQSAAQRERIQQNAKRQFNAAMAQKRKGSAAALNQAIRSLQKVKQVDPSDTAGLHGRVDNEIAAIKRTLRRAAESLLSQGKAEVARRDWIRARDALNRAAAIDPYNRETKRLLAQVEAECTKSAQQNFKKAQVFESINNYSDAREQCKAAMRYHPRPTDAINIKCRELLKRLDRKQEGLR